MNDYRDFQLLLYVPAEKYQACIRFYEDVFGVASFYGWEENEYDRGKKYRIGGTTIVILTQENPFPEYGLAHFQIEVDNMQDVYNRMKDSELVRITQEPFTRPYGWKMFRLVDPAGNHINIYQA